MNNQKRLSDINITRSYIGEYDSHIINLIDWCYNLQILIDEIRVSEMDVEREHELNKIIDSWTQEIGMRIRMLLDKINK